MMRFYNHRWQPLNPNPRADPAFVRMVFDYHSRDTGHAIEDLLTNNDKSDKAFVELLSKATNIDESHLYRFKPGMENIRMKLNWACDRTTTRTEDMAYALMGIFDVQLAIMYGEGKKAFFRLQEEIMKRTSDVGLFVWNGDCSPYNGMIAGDITCFKSPVEGLDDDAFYDYEEARLGRRWDGREFEELGDVCLVSYHIHP
jgi:hypothetical protein